VEQAILFRLDIEQLAGADCVLVRPGVIAQVDARVEDAGAEQIAVAQLDQIRCTGGRRP
jgi:hypothetical protein